MLPYDNENLYGTASSMFRWRECGKTVVYILYIFMAYFVLVAIKEPPSDEGGGFCEAKDGGRDTKMSGKTSDPSENQTYYARRSDSRIAGGVYRIIEN